MSLTVRGPRVLVEAEDQSITERESGIVTVEQDLPDVVGVIVAAGTVWDVTVGDAVIFPPSAGQVVEWGGRRYVALREDELLAVVEG